MPEESMIEKAPSIGHKVPEQSSSIKPSSPDVRLGKRRTLVSYIKPDIIRRITQGAHGLVEKLPDIVDKKTINKGCCCKGFGIGLYGVSV